MQYCKYISFLFVFVGLLNPTYSDAGLPKDKIAQVKVNGDKYVAMTKEATTDPDSIIEWVPEGAFVRESNCDDQKFKGTIDRIPVYWCKVEYNKRGGFILKHLLIRYKNESGDNGVSAAAKIKPHVNRYINLRENPISDADFTGCVPEGEIVPIVSPLMSNLIEGDSNPIAKWYKINYEGLKGFISAELIDVYFLDPEKLPESSSSGSFISEKVYSMIGNDRSAVPKGEDGVAMSFVDRSMLNNDKISVAVDFDVFLKSFEMKCKDLRKIFNNGSRYVINEDFNYNYNVADSACFNSAKSLNSFYEINEIKRRIISLRGSEDESSSNFVYLLNNKFEYKEGDILLLCDDEESEVKLIKVMGISSGNKMSYSIINKIENGDKEETLILGSGRLGTILPKIVPACQL